MKKIGIFCSASENIDKMYFDATYRLGEWMGREGKTLVYGGANLGLMECIASAVKANGGYIIGVVPTKLEENGIVSSLPDRIIQTRDLSERKDIMTHEAEILVALPGGLGTLDEIFHVLSAATLGYHDKKVIFYNVDGCYDKLLEALDILHNQKLIRQETAQYYRVADTLEELIKLI